MEYKNFHALVHNNEPFKKIIEFQIPANGNYLYTVFTLRCRFFDDFLQNGMIFAEGIRTTSRNAFAIAGN